MADEQLVADRNFQRWRAKIAYDGSAYGGWQVQPGRVTVQGELENALERLWGMPTRLHCSGRTDAGVHARAQVVHFDGPLLRRWETAKLQRALNASLKPDIRVLAVDKVAADFHARFSAKAKEYRYFIYNNPVLLPFLRAYRCHVYKGLDLAAMQKAAGYLIGEHDFAAFSANPHREVDGTVRHLQCLKVQRRGPEIVIKAQGDGFLYKMVRSLAGFLIRVGNGEIAPEEAAVILDSKIRTARVPTAQPQGLFLWKVMYK